MSWTGLAAAAALMIPTQPAAPDAATLRGWSPPGAASEPAEAPRSAEISVLTYNVHGLPWPIAWGRAAALRAIGQELAQMRREGRNPDVVLIQEGFRGEVADLVKASGYRYWAQGPRRSERAMAPAAAGRAGWRTVRYPTRGEGWGKLTGSGLHVLSDLPITRIEGAAYRYCAGFDCLADKGVMLVRLALPGGQEVDVVNTHLNSRRKAGVPLARSLQAHNLQIDELLAFLAERQGSGRPLLVGGDFNVRNAPERYNYRQAARPFKVVAEYCGAPAAGCQGYAPPAQALPWLKSQDLQAFESDGSAEVRPIRVDSLFSQTTEGGRLSDHDGYLVRYRISWSRGAPGGVQAANGPDDRPGAAAPPFPQDTALRPIRASGGPVVALRGD